MYSNVTGLSIGIGLSSALDTLCGQAHTGSKDSFAAGKHLQRALVLMVITAILVSPFWLWAERILVFICLFNCSSYFVSKILKYRAWLENICYIYYQDYFLSISLRLLKDISSLKAS
jgi:hypothetical protein